MPRLVAVLIAVAALLGLIDWVVPRLLHGEIFTRAAIAHRERGSRRTAAGNLREIAILRASALERMRRRWGSISDEKAADELRVFVIGNSAAISMLLPSVIEARLQSALPERDVSVTPLMFPAARVRDERVLSRAALSKGADVLVFTPNLKGLREGRSQLSSYIAATYGSREAGASRVGPADKVRSLLNRHWRLYRARHELRDLALELVRLRLFADSRDEEDRAIEAAFAAISDAARRGDFAALVAAYRDHGMSGLLRAPAEYRPPPPASSIYRTLKATAGEVTGAGVLGVAVFLPVNPIFREAGAVPGFEQFQVDDLRLRDLVDRTLGIYREAGFVTVDLVDALPAGSFLDVAHANSEGLRPATEQVAAVLVRALR